MKIERHKYSDLVVSMCVDIYIGCNCGLRTTAKIVAYLNERFHWKLESIPSTGSIKNWVEKCGYSIYNEPLTQSYDEDYAIITDESMMVGSEKMLLTLGVKAEKKDKQTLSFQDLNFLDISVKQSWNSEKITKVLTKVEDKIGKAPSYVLSDNASTITKAVREKGLVHIPDISHTLAMYIERKYKNDESFIGFTKALAQVKLRENMKYTNYLLPPKQRVIARFMNITPCIVWAQKLLLAYDTLTQEEQAVFDFIKDHSQIIKELHEITEVTTSISTLLKSDGASEETIKQCLQKVTSIENSSCPRVVDISLDFHQYLMDIQEKLPSKKQAWHVSSDIIESCFGKYKGRKSCNPLDGVTRQVLILPILSKFNSKKMMVTIDFKKALETNFLSDLNSWSNDNLTENMTVKRRRVLNAA
jgi:hypothetical protein